MDMKASVIGATGYAGVELLRLLDGHPEAEIAVITSESSTGEAIASMYPHLSGRIEKNLQSMQELDAIAAASETTFIPEDILATLSTKWSKILILYDRDATGMSNARKLSKKYGYDAFFIHKSFKAKDISDAVRDNGFDKVKQWLTKTLSRYEDTMIQNVES